MLQNNPTLKAKIDQLWNKFWAGGISNPLTAIEQITYRWSSTLRATDWKKNICIQYWLEQRTKALRIETMKKKDKWRCDVSRAFCKALGDYILLADNIDEARNRAAMAGVAWNNSLYPQDQIAEHIRDIALGYEKNNPGIVKAEYLSRDLQTLVDKKVKKFPNIKRTITKISVEDNGDKYEIITESIPFVL